MQAGPFFVTSKKASKANVPLAHSQKTVKRSAIRFLNRKGQVRSYDDFTPVLFLYSCSFAFAS
jgi:hypothetical protein